MSAGGDTIERMFDTMHEVIPPNLETMEPGHVLAAFLDHVDLERCSEADRVRVLKAQRRLLSYRQAELYRTMTSIVEVIDPEDMTREYVEEAAAAEIAAALRLTRRASDTEVALAIELRQRLPRVWQALSSGDIDLRRAKVLIDGTSHLTMAGARSVIDDIIEDACRLTTGQLGHKLRKRCIEVDPEDAWQRYQGAVENRRIAMEPDPSGTAHFFGMNMPPDRLGAGMQRVNRIAKNLRRDGETRTMDQLRADVFLDLLDGVGSAPRSADGAVHLHTDLPTLAGLADHPGEIAGFGPVVADVARQVAEHQQQCEWRWTLVDPDSGLPIDGGIIRRRPTASQRRYVQARYRTCIHPGCRMPAVDCDIDHRITWTESHTTRTRDLLPLCRHHHVIRHRHGWTYRPLPDGDFEFTSPLGLTYTTSGRSP